MKNAVDILASYSASASTFVQLRKSLKKLEHLRAKHAKDGVQIPPLLIVSTTEACNLTCTGCYSCAKVRNPDGTLFR